MKGRGKKQYPSCLAICRAMNGRSEGMEEMYHCYNEKYTALLVRRFEERNVFLNPEEKNDFMQLFWLRMMNRATAFEVMEEDKKYLVPIDQPGVL